MVKQVSVSSPLFSLFSVGALEFRSEEISSTLDKEGLCCSDSSVDNPALALPPSNEDHEASSNMIDAIDAHIPSKNEECLSLLLVDTQSDDLAVASSYKDSLGGTCNLLGSEMVVSRQLSDTPEISLLSETSTVINSTSAVSQKIKSSVPDNLVIHTVNESEIPIGLSPESPEAADGLVNPIIEAEGKLDKRLLNG